LSDDILSFEDHRRRQDDNPSLVRCARCAKMILATATRCPQCGVHFQGEAQDYLHPSERTEVGRSNWVVVLFVVLLAAAVMSALLFQ
jgi:hypothetical protein